jgi:hypothetical protein
MEGNFAGEKILGELAKLFAYRMLGLNAIFSRVPNSAP